MSKNNKNIANLLRSIATIYQLKNSKNNRFRIEAYNQAANAIEILGTELKDVWENNRLETIPGIGKSISKYLDELFKTGKVEHFKELKKGYPTAMFKLLEVKGIGPKTCYQLCTKLNIKRAKNSINKLRKKAENKEIRELDGFGKTSEENILKAIREYEKIKPQKERMLLPYAEHLSEKILKYLRQNKFVENVHVLGSLRRKQSTVGDLDFAVKTNHSQKVIKYFLKYSKIKKILASGTQQVSVKLENNRQIDLKTEKPSAFGALLQHYTGSKQHNINLRKHALKQGFSLSEHGIKKLKSKKLIKTPTEKIFYKKLGLQYIPPVLRQGYGEIKKAQKNQIPKLIQLQNIKGDLHIHSSFDIKTSHDLGANNMNEIVKSAVKRNYKYIAFSEHNPRRSQNKSKDVFAILKEKRRVIEQKRLTWLKKLNILVFNSLEIDILPNGELAIPQEALNYLDFAIISIHSSFSLSRIKQTQRILKALNHPKVKILAHPTGRKIQHRQEIDVDWDKIFDFCKKNNKILEINAFPDRLDLPVYLIKLALKKNILFSINSDAHCIKHMSNMKYGVYTAQRGWCTKENIINTFPIEKLKTILYH